MCDLGQIEHYHYILHLCISHTNQKIRHPQLFQPAGQNRFVVNQFLSIYKMKLFSGWHGEGMSYFPVVYGRTMYSG